MGTRFFRVLLGCQNFNNEKIIWLSWYCILTCEVYFYLHFTKDFSLAGKFHRTMYVNLQGYSCTYILWIQCFFMVQVKFTVLRIHRFVISGPATYCMMFVTFLTKWTAVLSIIDWLNNGTCTCIYKNWYFTTVSILVHELQKCVQVFFNFRYIQIKTLLMINNDGCITDSIYMLHWTTKYIKMKLKKITLYK